MNYHNIICEQYCNGHSLHDIPRECLDYCVQKTRERISYANVLFPWWLILIFIIIAILDAYDNMRDNNARHNNVIVQQVHPIPQHPLHLD